jgi:O-methyltransferase
MTIKLFNFEIRKINKKKRSIIEASKIEEKLIQKCLQYSMTNKERMWSLIQSFHHVRQESLSGDFVECGVWKGGNIILLKKLIHKFNFKKKIYGYDTFEGMAEPSSCDVNYNNKSAKKMFDEHKEKKIGFAMCSLEEVRKNIIKNTNVDNILLIKGKVETTLKIKKNLPKKISILRLDTDFYESTKIELEILFPKLVKGGVLIIDDYGFWKGSKKAVDEYFGNYRQFLHYIDHSCRLLIKK